MQERDARHPGSIAALGFAALGVVFGDIGTSPLYTLKTVLDLTGDGSTTAMLRVLSLIVWTLIAITTIKYVTIAMRVDNDGEGGILALMALLGVKRQKRPAIVALGLFGAALIYGDGAITPAISVLSALEGLTLAAPGLGPYVVPMAVAILVVLFAVQSQGTARIGNAFGPVMAARFCAIAMLGVWGIAKHPAVLLGLDPRYAISYLAHDGFKAFAVLGGVFLCVTGAEALYADMGHFGAKPIRLAWSAIVFPSLVLNYAGQAAIVLADGVTADNIFYRLCPAPLLVPMIVLATVATVIASQSIITGAFSMTRQAIQLGWFPRLKIVQTSPEGYGQIYVGPVNWMLMVATIALTIGFGKSDNLAAAYGIAVSATMLMTSALLLIAMREIWQWSLPASIGLAGIFLVIDAAFVVSNSLKIVDGGYVPLLLAGAVYTMMFIWHRGAAAITERIHEGLIPLDTFMAKLEQDRVPRVPGTAVFLTRAMRDTPPVLVWHVRHNRALQQHVLAITTVTESVPWIADEKRVTFTQAAPNFWRAIAHYGLMERPDIPHLLAQLKDYGCTIDLADVTYFVGHETVTRREDGRGLPRWQEALFAFYGAQCSPSDRLLQPSRRSGRRDRTADFDLRWLMSAAWTPDLLSYTA
jgi:KUP system potassium uptake protein